MVDYSYLYYIFSELVTRYYKGFQVMVKGITKYIYIYVNIPGNSNLCDQEKI